MIDNVKEDPKQAADAELFDDLLQENTDLHARVRKLAEENKSLSNRLRRSLDEIERIEQSIRENRELYYLAIEAANLSIYDTGVKDEDLALKENWLARLGYDPAKARADGITWESLIHPDDYDRVIAAFEKILKGKVPSLSIDYRLRAANGEYRWIIESSKSIGTSRIDGKLRIVGTHFDITEQKKAEEAEKEQRIFTDALSASTSVFNSTLNLNKLINLILINVGKVVPNDDSDIWLLDDQQKIARPAIRKGMDGKVILNSSMNLPVEQIRIFQEIINTHQPVYLPDVPPDSCPIPSRNPNLRSCITSPVIFGKYLLGFLVLNSSKPNFYTSTHIQRLQAFANQAAVAIRNAQLYSQAQEAAALEERQRLAREMHDVISQTLFSASIKAEALTLMVETEDHEKLKENLVELHKLTRGALAEMRTMLMELRPNVIANTEFTSLLRQLVEGSSGRTTSTIKLTTEGTGLLPPEVQTVFFRITQEAINNVLKHSKADQVRVNYKNDKKAVTLLIEDNGCGFYPNKVATDRMGVRIMRERADSINAKFTLHSRPGSGARISLVWEKP